MNFKNRQSAAKINNFMRLEPTINLLDIPFNTNIAREIMQEKKTSATQLLYQIYIALTNKQKRNLTGMAMETMRPAGPVKLEQYESKIYQNVITDILKRSDVLIFIFIKIFVAIKSENTTSNRFKS